MSVPRCSPALEPQPLAGEALGPGRWNATALDDLADYARGQRSTALLVIEARRTVLERNWPLPAGSEAFERRYTHGRTREGVLREDVASQQKSLVALLVAIAAERGLLDPAQPVSSLLAEGWSRAGAAQERAIRIHHLLEMCSGLDETLSFVSEPGRCHFYNTPAYALLLPLLEAAAAQPLEVLTRQWLTGPAAMVDTDWCTRGAELAAMLGNPRGLVTTPRDLARLGQLILDDGLAEDGSRVIGPAALAAVFRRTALHPAYGQLWWLNGGSHWVMPRLGLGAGSVVRTAPPDARFAMGSENRFLMLVPSRQRILVRLGCQAPDGELREQLAQRLARAAGDAEATEA